ncbi:hypothetical protein E8E15_004721 [Penicillium rubens]|uniref:Mannosyl-oligosaccharide 1,2-alpha-mannosidase n=1 Tax=Penicillium chrysogenum TaxID=5076 RepID=A0A167WUW2_PENCH|nr:Glycoside hydrolase family 47 [Penicillium rubens]KZN92080.1 Mannosyl-oligosaccharide 1,2-alpha-mannosidase [Penicillium chrysogenum]KAF3020388.1 hypothetical protein E8E15_004721 [Penicillium rubens]KAJ5039646.1 hypothetical protein NUH16_009431 [Penicillium rubens]KAJ5842885.1 Glycoside hydrolase family 47 [Penicillium rubens]KAJ5846538.1 Glycoside hydrolase family 47 [Penicillium rubens]
MPESFEVVPCASQESCPLSEWQWKQEVWKNANRLEPEPNLNLNVDTFIRDHRLPKGFTEIPDTACNLRPEAIESIFTLYRAKNGNAAIGDVTDESGEMTLEDSMEGMWMSQTLKYFYLMFISPDLINLYEFVFNAGGHPLKRPNE